MNSSTYMQFQNNLNILGSEFSQITLNTKILIVGLGGIGTWVVESLARLGFSQFTLVDLDDFCLSNINRQLHATHLTIGQFKIDVLKEKILDINPNACVITHQLYFNEKNIEIIFSDKIDLVIDTIDDFYNKCFLINYCYKNNFSIITTGVAGGKINPTKIQIADLNKTFNDPLLLKIRKRLRIIYNFPRGKSPFGIQCVFSSEIPKKKSPGNLHCSGELGSLGYVTGIFGLYTTYAVVKELLKLQNE